MDCPADGTQLHMSERNGVEIDYCPKCRGVWLDRGEIDKVIERAGAFDAPVEYARQHDRQYEQKHYPKKKPKSFLKEMLEFGD